jgi:POT family proton-dependent oligopeptide transporter
MKEKYPPGLLALCTMQATSMVGFMLIFSMSTLYMTHVLGFSDKNAVTLFAAFGAIVYGLPLFGGFLGDKYLGYKFSVLVSTILCGIGLLLISIPKPFFFIIGLACFSISTCVQVPNTYCLVGNLYDKQDERRHGGFTLAYVAMNIGAFAATFGSGFLSTHLGYSATFIAGAVIMFSTLIAFFLANKYFDDGFRSNDNIAVKVIHDTKSRIKGLVLYFLAIPICALGFHHPDVCNNLILIIAVLAAIYIFVIGFQYDSVQRKKLYVFLALTTVSIGWGVLYMMAPTVLTLFVERNVDRHFLGLLIPPSSVLSLNPFFIIICGPMLSYLWLLLSHKNRNPSGAFKLSFGVILMGIGFILLVPAILSANSLGLTAFFWIILSYLFQTLGELFVNPVGYALAGTLSPPGRDGFLMGFFQLGSGAASVLMGYLASEANQLEGIKAPLQTNNMYLHAFWHYGLYSIILGMIALIFVPYFSKIIRSTGSNL